MKQLLCVIMICLLCGCVSTSEQSAIVNVDDPLEIQMFVDDSKQEMTNELKKQFDSSIKIVENENQIITHPDLIIAIGVEANRYLETSIPILRVNEKEITMKDKVTFLQKNTNYKNLVTVDCFIEGIESLPNDDSLQKNLKEKNPDAVILNDGLEHLSCDYPIVLSQHHKNVVDVEVDEKKTIEKIVQMSQQVFNGLSYQEHIPLSLMIRSYE